MSLAATLPSVLRTDLAIQAHHLAAELHSGPEFKVIALGTEQYRMDCLLDVLVMDSKAGLAQLDALQAGGRKSK